jgi:predicted acylesterase/phospholipase RssA
VVAVNVGADRDPGRNYTFGTSISGWQVLSSRIRRRPLNVPTLFASLLRTMEINEVHSRKAKLALADLLINPPIAAFSLLEFESWEAIIEVGYRAAQGAIAAWKNSPKPETDQLEGSLVRT